MGSGTFVAPLTPPGRSAIASVAVWGERPAEVVEPCFRPASGRPLSGLPPGRIALGVWAPEGEDGGEEVVLARLDERTIEIHCHGGHRAVERLVQDLCRLGCQERSWTDWLAWREPDGIGRQAVCALAAAPTTRCATILLAQHQQALRRRIERIVAALQGTDSQQAEGLLDRLLALAPLGLHLTSAFRVLISGPVNVGKSSLVNALAGYKRCIVLDHPGTTRDLVRLRLAMEGWPVELIDTAGFRQSTDPLEQAGMQSAQREAQQADLIVWVQPCGGTGDASRLRGALRAPETVPILNVASMADRVERRPDAGDWLVTSAVTGEGLGQLAVAIVRQLVPIVPEPGEAVPFTGEQVSALRRARQALQERRPGDAAKWLLALLSGG